MKIIIIMGSTRPGRFSEKPAHWIFEELKKRKDVEPELIDLRDYPMPFYNDPKTPSMLNGHYPDKSIQRWADKIKQADGYIIVTPEYNHGYPAVLKNALDNIFVEWNKKPIAFVSYGSAMGARSVEQLRQVAVELQMYPIRNAITIPIEVYLSVSKENPPIDPVLFEPARRGFAGDKLEIMFNELIAAATAMESLRGGVKQ